MGLEANKKALHVNNFQKCIPYIQLTISVTVSK